MFRGLGRLHDMNIFLCCQRFVMPSIEHSHFSPIVTLPCYEERHFQLQRNFPFLRRKVHLLKAGIEPDSSFFRRELL